MTIELMDFERRRQTWIAGIMMIVLILFVAWMYPKDADGNSDRENAPERVQEGILWLVTPPNGADAETVRRYHGSRAYEDAHYRQRLSYAFLKTSREFDIPVWLLVGIGYRESVFRMDEVGDAGGSLGMMQVCEQGRRACREYCGELETLEEHALCGACWLDKGRQWCGDLEGGLSAYINGNCELETVKAKRAYKIRMKLVSLLEERFGKI